MPAEPETFIFTWEEMEVQYKKWATAMHVRGRMCAAVKRSTALQNLKAAKRFLEGSNVKEDGRLWQKGAFLSKIHINLFYKYARELIAAGRTKKYIADQVCFRIASFCNDCF